MENTTTSKEVALNVPPHDLELEDKLLTELEKQQAKKQTIQSFIDYIPEGLFYSEEHQTRYGFIVGQHKQQRRRDIPQQQAHWLSDLIDLKKKRDLLQFLQECQAKVYANKQSFKIIKSRHFAQVEAI